MLTNTFDDVVSNKNGHALNVLLIFLSTPAILLVNVYMVLFQFLQRLRSHADEENLGWIMKVTFHNSHYVKLWRSNKVECRYIMLCGVNTRDNNKWLYLIYLGLYLEIVHNFFFCVVEICWYHSKHSQSV